MHLYNLNKIFLFQKVKTILRILDIEYHLKSLKRHMFILFDEFSLPPTSIRIERKYTIRRILFDTLYLLCEYFAMFQRVYDCINTHVYSVSKLKSIVRRTCDLNPRIMSCHFLFLKETLVLWFVSCEWRVIQIRLLIFDEIFHKILTFILSKIFFWMRLIYILLFDRGLFSVNTLNVLSAFD